MHVLYFMVGEKISGPEVPDIKETHKNFSYKKLDTIYLVGAIGGSKDPEADSFGEGTASSNS